jgi:hypothetical protein
MGTDNGKRLRRTQATLAEYDLDNEEGLYYGIKINRIHVWQLTTSPQRWIRVTLLVPAFPRADSSLPSLASPNRAAHRFFPAQF